MSLKKGTKILYLFLGSIIGAVISYLACQYTFLDVKAEFNVIELLVSIGTIGIGLYIAFVLEQHRNKSQNFYNYVETKYDSLWEDFINFSEVLEESPNVEISEIAKWNKKINQKLSPLIKVFESFEYDSTCLKKIDTKLDDLDTFITSNEHISQGVLDLSQISTEVTKKLNDINDLFAKSFKDISEV